ncbi:MAG: hypothetical protein R3229_14095 [Alphaproteobacteria bacterium]|nr:hypothetical protein [Alphaproteobacteria bacterium]
MEETRFEAGNLVLAVRELHTRLGDGVSVDFLARDGKTETSLLRFDWFPDCPHYHYNPRMETMREVPLDPALVGDSMDWFLDRIPDRLPAMIESAGHPAVARAIDRAAIARLMPEIKGTAKSLAESVTAA